MRKSTGSERITGKTPLLPLANPHDVNLAPSKLPAWLQWGMIAVVGVLVVASGVYSALEHWRRATTCLGMGILWLGVVRLTCDSSRVGVLAVRSRRFDAVFCTLLSAAMLWLSASVDSLGS